MVRMFRPRKGGADAAPDAGKADEGAQAGGSSRRRPGAGLLARLGTTARVPHVVLAIALITGITGTGAGLFWAFSDSAATEVVVNLASPSVFYELPPFVADLKRGEGRPHYVKLGISVELAEEDIAAVQREEAAIRDAIQVRLRDYERDDLEGEAGARRLRSDLLAVVNKALAPATANTVLYRVLILD